MDVNDALLNTLGVLIGYALFRVFAWLYRWAAGHLGFLRGGHVYTVTNRAVAQP
jgi:hypothetical protein